MRLPGGFRIVRIEISSAPLVDALGQLPIFRTQGGIHSTKG
jgi:hypothetical protein